MSSIFNVVVVALGVFCLILLPFFASPNILLDGIWVALCLVMIIPGVTGLTNRGTGRTVLLGLRPMKGRLVFEASDITIYTLDPFAGATTSEMRIERVAFGNNSVRFRVRNRGPTADYNVGFSQGEFEGFKKLFEERKPTTLSWEFG